MRHALRELFEMRRQCNRRLVKCAFGRWAQWVKAQKQVVLVHEIERFSVFRLLASRWLSWCRFVQKRRMRLSALAYLHDLSVVFRVQLLRQRFASWVSFCTRRRRHAAALKALADTTTRHVLQIKFSRWRRRRLWKRQCIAVCRLKRAAFRSTLNRSLRKWLLFERVIRMASHLEQISLRVVARTYWGRWLHHTSLRLKLFHIRRRAEVALLHKYFSCKWNSFVWRIIRATLLEQQHLVVLVQRYYLKWSCSRLRYRPASDPSWARYLQPLGLPAE